MAERNSSFASLGKNKLPFICLFIPFICHFTPHMYPFVSYKTPLVRNKGFTFIELIITLTVAGILLALAVPGMNNFIQDERLSGQANELVADLNTARSEAIKRGINITICKQDSSVAVPQCNTNASTPWTGGRVMFIDTTTGTTGQIDTAETVLRNKQALSGNNTLTTSTKDITVATPTTQATNTIANLIVFTASGLTTIATGNEGWFQFCDNRGITKAITVMVNSTGRIRTTRTAPTTSPLASCP